MVILGVRVTYKKYGFYNDLPDELIYEFDEKTKATSIKRFVEIVRSEICIDTLRQQILSGEPEKWQVFQCVAKDKSFAKLRERLKSGEIRDEDLRQEALNTLFSCRWFMEGVFKSVAKADWRVGLRMGLPLALLVVGLVLCFTPAIIAAGLLLLLFVLSHLTGSYTQFSRDSTPQRSTWEGFRLAANVMVVAEAALLPAIRLVQDATPIVETWLVVSIMVGIFFGLLGILNSVDVREERRGKVTVNAFQWDMVVTLAYLQMGCLLFGIAAIFWAVSH